MKKLMPIALFLLVMFSAFFISYGKELPKCNCFLPNEKLYGVLDKGSVCIVTKCTYPAKKEEE